MKLFRTDDGLFVRNVQRYDTNYFSYEAMSGFGYWCKFWYDMRPRGIGIGLPWDWPSPSNYMLETWWQEQGGNAVFGYDIMVPGNRIPVCGRNLDSLEKAFDCAKHRLILGYPVHTIATVRVKQGDVEKLVYTIEYDGKLLTTTQEVMHGEYSADHARDPE